MAEGFSGGLRREYLSNACRWQLSRKDQTQAERLKKVVANSEI